VSDQPAPAPLDAERLQAILDGSPFIHFCGMRITALDPAVGRIVLAMELRPELERRQGTGQWHAGLIDTAGDFAVALGLGAVVPTINFRVDYLRPATTRHLTATATVRRAGRTVAVVDIDVEDAGVASLLLGEAATAPSPAEALASASPLQVARPRHEISAIGRAIAALGPF